MTNLRSENVADTIELYGNERYPVGYTCKAGLGVAAGASSSSRVSQAVLVGRKRGGRGAGPSQKSDRAEAGNGRRRHPRPSTMEAARRRGSPRNRYAVAKVRWPLRAVWSAAEADAPGPRAARPALTTPAVYL